jgi:Transposase
VIESHQSADIIAILSQQPIEIREQVEAVSIDMWGGFPKVMAQVFPNALLVYGRFHGIKLVNLDEDSATSIDSKEHKVSLWFSGDAAVLPWLVLDLDDNHFYHPTVHLRHSLNENLYFFCRLSFHHLF